MLVAGRRVVSMIAYPVWQVSLLLPGYEHSGWLAGASNTRIPHGH